jgi:GAF domain-containing protein
MKHSSKSPQVKGHGSSDHTKRMDIAWAPSPEFKVPIPKDEQQRLADLRRYQILHTPPEENFDQITLLASQICQTPMALVSLVDSDRQWFKSKVGLSISETSRNAAFCAHAIMQRDLFVVRDAAADKRFSHNPLVISDPKIRFYAGAPLVTPDNHAVGTLCVFDRVPRQLTREQVEALRALSRQVVALMELRREQVELQEALRQSQRTEADLQQAVQVLRAANEAKSELLRRVGHEIRTTMQGILQLTDPLLPLKLPAKARQQLRTIKSSAAALYTVAHDIATFIRLQGGKR